MILIVLAIPVLNLHLGQNDVGALPEVDHRPPGLRRASTRASAPGTNGPLLVAVKLDTPAKPDQKKLDDLNAAEQQEQQAKQQQQQQTKQQIVAQGVAQDAGRSRRRRPSSSAAAAAAAAAEAAADQQKQFLSRPPATRGCRRCESDIKKTPGVKSVSEPQVDNDGDAAIFTVIADHRAVVDADRGPGQPPARQRDPKGEKGTDLTADVGGQTAGYIDLADRIGDKLPSMILIVVGLSFVVLLLAFRSILSRSRPRW